jgi:signal transduction histidine kinase
VSDDVTAGRLAVGYETVLRPLSNLEDAVGRHREALSARSWRPSPSEMADVLQDLAGQIAAARQAVLTLQQAQHDDRRRLVHDLRGPLNAIAAWAYILRLESNARDNVVQAADVLERNVRALAQVIESA